MVVSQTAGAAPTRFMPSYLDSRMNARGLLLSSEMHTKGVGAAVDRYVSSAMKVAGSTILHLRRHLDHVQAR